MQEVKETKEIAATDTAIVNIEQITTEIIVYKNQTAQNFIEIGRRLIKVKEMLPHGEWGIYLKDRVNFSQNMANKLMRCAVEFPNCSTSNNLPIGKMFELLALPPADREKFVQQNDIEQMTVKKMRQQIKDFKEENSRLKEEKSILQSERDEYKSAADDIQKKLNKTRDDISTFIENNTQLKQKNAQLTEENADLNDAIAQSTYMARETDKYVQKLKAEIAELKQKAAGTTTIVTQDDPKTLAKIKELEQKLEDRTLVLAYDQILLNTRNSIISDINAYCGKLDFLVNKDNKQLKKHLANLEKIIADTTKIIADIKKDLK